jgi:uncharacterized membrane protein
MRYHENRHAVLIKARPGEVAAEIIRWGEAAWWPKDSLMSFFRLLKGPIELGTRYRQRVLLPFAPSWDVEVTALSDKGVTRKFLNGMFSGQETVSMKETRDGIEVSYLMHYRVNGALNWAIWVLFFKKLHDRNIEAILKNLKEYSEKGR